MVQVKLVVWAFFLHQLFRLGLLPVEYRQCKFLTTREEHMQRQLLLHGSAAGQHVVV